MLIVSSNDAVSAIASYIGNDKLLIMINKKARSLGMSDTRFYDATGLNASNQSSINDLAILVKYILAKHPEIFRITMEDEAVLNDFEFGRKNLIRNINEFVGNPDWLGGKTGYIDESRGNLVSIFGSGRGEFLVIVLGSENRFRDSTVLWEWTKSMIAGR